MYELIMTIANLKLFTGENMRRTPFLSGYRPIFTFKNGKTKVSAKISLIHMDSFAPGTTGIVQIDFIKGLIDDNNFKKGEVFTISEDGKTILGEGEIIELK